jgi:NAD(P)-dependent dehydrogenase (short-subunit alcohol dehydrogenase family)
VDHLAQPQRVALVTGANRGLGRALAEGLAKAHLRVFLAARVLADAREAAVSISQDVVPVQLDVTDPASVYRAFADIEQMHGRLDVLINNAAVAIDRGQPPSQTDMESAQATWDVNVLGVWRCCKQAIPLMRRGGYGRITNLTSHMSAATAGTPALSPAYAVSKAAVNRLTLALAAEARDRGDNILVNAASPGTVTTRMTYSTAEHSPAEAAEELLWLSTLRDDGPTGQIFAGRQTLGA